MLSFGGAKSDVWISAILAVILALLGGGIMLFLGQRYPSLNVVSYSRHILGNWLGGLVCLILIVFFIIFTSVSVRDFAELYLTYIMPYTPISVFIGFILVTAAYALRSGLQVIARFAGFLAPIVMLVIVFGILSSIPNMSLSNIMPVLPTDRSGIITDAMTQMSFFGMILVWLWFLPLTNHVSDSKTLLASIGIVGFFLLIVSTSIVLVLGPEIPVYTNYQFFALFQQIQLISIERIELLFILIWTGTSFLAVSLCYYIAASSLGQWLGLKTFHTIILPLGLIIFVLSISMFDSYMDLRRFFGLKELGLLALPIQFGLPLLLLTVDQIKRWFPRHTGKAPNHPDMV